jgi:multiple antibiotic resistance protein
MRNRTRPARSGSRHVVSHLWRGAPVRYDAAVAWRTFGQSFVTLLVILDPLGNIPVFLALTKRHEPKARHRAAYVSILVAALILAAFAAFGDALIRYLSISLESLMVAGGVLLFLVALDMLRGVDPLGTVAEDVSIALVPLGTPFLAGPGAIVATIVLVRQHHGLGQWLSVVAGAALALLVVLAALRFASALGRLLRPSAIHFLTRIMGLLLTAVAVQLVADAVARWIRAGVI